MRSIVPVAYGTQRISSAINLVTGWAVQPLWTLQAVDDRGAISLNSATAGIQSYKQNESSIILSWTSVAVTADASLNVVLTVNLAAGKRFMSCFFSLVLHLIVSLFIHVINSLFFL